MTQLQKVAAFIAVLVASIAMVAPIAVASGDDGPRHHKVGEVEHHKSAVAPGQARTLKYAHEAQCKDSLRGIGAYQDDDIHIWGVQHAARSFYGYGAVSHRANGQVDIHTGFIMADGALYWTYGHCVVDYSTSDWID